MNGKRVLILCTGNSCRSQMAEGLLRAKAPERFEVHSAGTRPSPVNPLAVAAMAEIGIDISRQTSKSVLRFVGQRFDYVITVCDDAAETCPVFPGPTTRLHWSIEDPALAKGTRDEVMPVFAGVRDHLSRKLDEWLAEPEAHPTPPLA